MLAVIFVAGGFVIRYIPPLASLAEDVLGYARLGNLALVTVILIVNGLAEELFFRGALFAAIGVRHPVLISTILYALTTVGSGNPVLVFAAAVLGAVTGLQRRGSGGVLAPILTHLTWSLTMLFVLPLDLPRLRPPAPSCGLSVLRQGFRSPAVCVSPAGGRRPCRNQEVAAPRSLEFSTDSALTPYLRPDDGDPLSTCRISSSAGSTSSRASATGRCAVSAGRATSNGSGGAPGRLRTNATIRAWPTDGSSRPRCVSAHRVRW